MIRPMVDADFEWAAELMEQRRELYELFSPVFWRPASGVAQAHGQFTQATAQRDGAVAFRSEHGFVLAYPHEGRSFIDDFAVDSNDHWATHGRELLLAAFGAARSPSQPVVRVVTARDDAPTGCRRRCAR